VSERRGYEATLKPEHRPRSEIHGRSETALIAAVLRFPMPNRRFPAPWTFDEANNACFIVRDGNRFPIAFIYFESEPGGRAAANFMTKDEARKIAAGIAKLPELLGVDRPAGNTLTQRRP